MQRRRIISLDFDGVLNSYKTGWEGHATISDAPVPGAIAWLTGLLLDKRFDVHMHSSRCTRPEGIAAMMRWFVKYGLPNDLLDKLTFAEKKPPASVTIDDRAIQFRGVFPSYDELARFAPWNRQTDSQTAEKKNDVDYSMAKSPEEATAIWELEHRCLSCLHGQVCAVSVGIQSTDALIAVTKCTNYIESGIPTTK